MKPREIKISLPCMIPPEGYTIWASEPPDLYYYWMHNGKPGERKYRKLSDAVESAHTDRLVHAALRSLKKVSTRIRAQARRENRPIPIWDGEKVVWKVPDE